MNNRYCQTTGTNTYPGVVSVPREAGGGEKGHEIETVILEV